MTTTPHGVIHWTPEEVFYSACGGGQEGDLATLNADKVTCPGCRKVIDGGTEEGSRS